MTTLLDYIPQGSRGNVRTFLGWIGAIQPATKDAPEEICIYNLKSIVEEVSLLLPTVAWLSEQEEIECREAEIAEDAITALLDEIERMEGNDPILAEICPVSGGKQLMHGHICKFPLYCLLPYVPADKQMVDRHRSYKATMLVLSSELNDFGTKTGREYRASIAGAANALRLAADREFMGRIPDLEKVGISATQEALKKMTDAAQIPSLEKVGISSTQEGLEQMKDPAKIPVTSHEANYLASLARIFNAFARKSGRTGLSKTKIKVDHRLDNTEKSGANVTVSRNVSVSAKELREARKSGLAPSELTEEIEYITENEDPDEEEAEAQSQQPQTMARQALRMRQRLNAIERGVQMLPTAPNRMAPWEQATFLRTIKNSQPTGATDASAAVRHSACAALATSFWLSKTLGVALRVKIYKAHSNLPSSFGRDFLGYVQESREWVLAGLRPKGEPAYANIDKSCAIPVANHLLIPDVASVGAYLEKLSSWALAKINGHSSAFLLQGARVEQECKEIVKQAKSISNGRITLARIADSVFLSVLDTCQDKATASLVLARPHRLGDTQLHYTTVSTDSLRKIYTDTCRRIAEAALVELKGFDLKAARPAGMGKQIAQDSTYIGCAICPTDTTMQKLATTLARAVDQARLEVDSASFMVKFSNLYTCYVIMQLIHLTGLRAVKKPIPDADNIDFINNILLASDKDDYTSFNTHIIPLVRVLALQLKHYQNHRKTVISRIGLIDPKLALKHGQNPKLAQKHEKEPLPTGLFFLLKIHDGKICITDANPSRVRDIVKEHCGWFGLPDNCQRSRLRSKLLELECMPQWIDATLGHWSRGEEPLHCYATTSLLRICNGVRDKLEKIARQDGWRPLRGLG